MQDQRWWASHEPGWSGMKRVTQEDFQAIGGFRGLEATLKVIRKNEITIWLEEARQIADLSVIEANSAEMEIWKNKLGPEALFLPKSAEITFE